MSKHLRLKPFARRALRRRYLKASDEDRAALRPALEASRDEVVQRMVARGYRLEATVSDVMGLFTRGPARGSIRLHESPTTEPAG